MPGSTTELGLSTAVDADDTADYLTLSLANSLRTVDALYNNVTGHTHSGAHQGGPIGAIPAGAIPDGSITSAKIVDGSVMPADLAVPVDITGVFRSQNTAGGVPTSGAGIEMYYNPSTGTGTGIVLAYDRTNAAYKTLDLQGTQVTLSTSGTTRARVMDGFFVSEVPLVVNAAGTVNGDFALGPAGGGSPGLFRKVANATVDFYNTAGYRFMAGDGATLYSAIAPDRIYVGPDIFLIRLSAGLLQIQMTQMGINVAPQGTYLLSLPNIASGAGQGIANAWVPYSAARGKTNIRPLTEALELLQDPYLHAVRYQHRESGTPSVGFIADNWLSALPEVVALDEVGAPIGLDYDRIGAITWQALKEYVHQTNARLAALEQAA